MNALFSSLSGLIMILFNQQLSKLFGIENHTAFWVVGLALFYFAITIAYEMKKQRRFAILWIIIQDFIWVVASIVILVFNPFQITQIGNIIIAIIAIIVLYMGIIQLNALNKSNSN